MTTLRSHMSTDLPLDLKDKFKDGSQREISAEEALKSEFIESCEQLNLSYTGNNILFSVDSINETPSQEDKFIAQIMLGKPNAKICHMRQQVDEEGKSGWYALFTELDDKGRAKEILIIDPITPNQHDAILNNPFYSQKKIFVKQGLFDEETTNDNSWKFALFNLAHLAAPYNAEMIYEQAALQIIDNSGSGFIRSTNPSSFFSTKTPSPEEAFYYAQKEKTYSSTTTGKSLVGMGAGLLLAGGLALVIPSPFSLLLGTALITMGIVMELVGVIMLIDDCIKSYEQEEYLSAVLSN